MTVTFKKKINLSDGYANYYEISMDGAKYSANVMVCDDIVYQPSFNVWREGTEHWAAVAINATRIQYRLRLAMNKIMEELKAK